MKLVSFCILTALALVYAGLVLFESTVYRSWDRLVTENKQIQQKLTYIQHRQEVTAQLLRRMAIESQRDPAFAQLMKQYHINVVVNSDAMKLVPGANSPMGTPDKPDQAPPISTPAAP